MDSNKQLLKLQISIKWNSFTSEIRNANIILYYRKRMSSLSNLFQKKEKNLINPIYPALPFHIL